MKALPFPCIRPAQDRVLEALPAMGSILSGNDALRGAIADGLMLKDPGAAYYVYECSSEPGRVTGVVAICPVNVLPPRASTHSPPCTRSPSSRCSRAPCRSPTRRRPSWISSWAPPKRAPRSTPSPILRALHTACGRLSARTPSAPSVPCSTRRRSRYWPTTLPTLAH